MPSRWPWAGLPARRRQFCAPVAPMPGTCNTAGRAFRHRGRAAHHGVGSRRQSHLPDGVAIRWAQPVNDVRFMPASVPMRRRYRYLLLNRPQRPGLWLGRVGWFHGALDLAAMRRLLTGCSVSTISPLSGRLCQAKSPIKTMTHAAVHQCGSMFVFDFEASAFLHHMVRNLVGTLVYIGKGLSRCRWMDALLQMKDRKLAAPTFRRMVCTSAAPSMNRIGGLPMTDDDFLDGILTRTRIQDLRAHPRRSMSTPPLPPAPMRSVSSSIRPVRATSRRNARAELAKRIPPLSMSSACSSMRGPEVVRAACDAPPINILQFHGDEDAAYCRQFSDPWLKAAR